MPRISISTFLFYCFLSFSADAQTLNMKDAVNTAVANYGTIKAKINYVNASKQGLEQSRREYLPNFSLSAQHNYGTINGLNSPQAPFVGALNASSSGPSLASQNWNAAFGSLYLSSVSWDFFTFGRVKERIKVSRISLKRDENDLDQEIFQHEIRVSAAYLNLLAAQRLTKSQEKNLDRAIVFKNNTVARAKSGLIAGVDSALAHAQVSNARIQLTNAVDLQQEQANRLGILLGVTSTDFKVDTALINHVPRAILAKIDTNVNLAQHPSLKFQRNRVELSNQQANFFKRLMYPTFSLIGILQGRGSGFSPDYANDMAYTSSYTEGIHPTRTNYLFGVGVVWNLTSILRTSPQVKAQHYTTMGLENEYQVVDQQLHAQLALSEMKIRNAMANYTEAPDQVKAAEQAYLQKSVQYKNGLATLVDLTQALFVLNRAETDRDIAYTNVWQALLMKSAAMGDYNIFINEF